MFDEKNEFLLDCMLCWEEVMTMHHLLTNRDVIESFSSSVKRCSNWKGFPLELMMVLKKSKHVTVSSSLLD